MPWNPDIYNKFRAERYEPFYDLLRECKPKPGMAVVDLGCGTGEMTAELARKLPESDVLGIDASAEMLQKSAAFAGSHIRFERRTIQQQIALGTNWDLVFSNAALQWLDHHERLIPELISLLHPGGQLLVQVPSNHTHYTHTFLQELALTEPYRGALGGWIRTTPVLSISDYADLLYAGGGKEISVFEKVYSHIVDDASGLYEWVTGTALIPYLEKLPEHLKSSFAAQYKKGLRDHFPGHPVFYPFKRILMKAVF